MDEGRTIRVSEADGSGGHTPESIIGPDITPIDIDIAGLRSIMWKEREHNVVILLQLYEQLSGQLPDSLSKIGDLILGKAFQRTEVLQVMNQRLATACLSGHDATTRLFQDQPGQLRVVDFGGIKSQRDSCGQLPQIWMGGLQRLQSVPLPGGNG